MALTFFQDLKISAGSTSVTYQASVPANSVGYDGDVVVLTTTGAHYKKITGIWTLQLSGSTPTKRYADRTALQTASGSMADGFAIVTTEPGNIYLRNSTNTQWIVMSGNKYATINLPDTSTFTIPSGTVIFDITTSSQIYE